MQIEIKYEYSPELVKRVSRRFLLKTMIWQYVLALALGLYALFTFLIGIESWFQGVPITLLVIYIFHWLGYERNAAAVSQNLASRSVIVRFDDEAISFQTIDHQSITKWSRFKQVMKLQEAWLFFTYYDSYYTLIPTHSLSDELKAFIERKITDHGGQIA